MEYSSFFLFLFTAMPLSLAQNSTNTTCNTEESTHDSEVKATTFNSTGSVSWLWNNAENDSQPWYISLLLNDTSRGRNVLASPRGQAFDLSGFVSTAPDVVARFCVYVFPAENATSTGNGANNTGCAGVLSDSCAEYLVEAMQNASSSTIDPGGSCGGLPDADSDQKRRTEACGEGKLTGSEGESYSVQIWIVYACSDLLLSPTPGVYLQFLVCFCRTTCSYPRKLHQSTNTRELWSVCGTICSRKCDG